MLQHTLIVGTTGSGKSWLENKLIERLHEDKAAQFILIDPKRVELKRWKGGPDCLAYAKDESGYRDAIVRAYDHMQLRFDQMEESDLTEYDGDPIYVVVDEMGVLMNGSSRDRRMYGSMLGDIAMAGRAARVFLVLCTQLPTRENLPNSIRDNMTNKVVLRLDDMGRARFVLGGGSAVGELPRYGAGYVKTPDMMHAQRMTTDEIIKALGV